MLNTFYSKVTGFLIERNTLFPRRLEFFPPLRTDGTHWLEPFQGRRQTFTQVTFIVVFVSNSFWRGSRHRRFDLRLIENTWTLDLMYFFFVFRTRSLQTVVSCYVLKMLGFYITYHQKRAAQNKNNNNNKWRNGKLTCFQYWNRSRNVSFSFV